MNKDNIIADLVALILMQEEEINKLKDKIARVKQYLEVYEEYIKGDDY